MLMRESRAQADRARLEELNGGVVREVQVGVAHRPSALEIVRRDRGCRVPVAVLIGGRREAKARHAGQGVADGDAHILGRPFAPVFVSWGDPTGDIRALLFMGRDLMNVVVKLPRSPFPVDLRNVPVSIGIAEGVRTPDGVVCPCGRWIPVAVHISSRDDRQIVDHRVRVIDGYCNGRRRTLLDAIVRGDGAGQLISPHKAAA